MLAERSPFVILNETKNSAQDVLELIGDKFLNENPQYTVRNKGGYNMQRWGIMCLFALLLFGGAQTAAEAISIEVFQGGVFLGTVTPYSGPLSGADNYNFWSYSGHPIYGPTQVAQEGQIFFYNGSDGLNFTAIFAKDNSDTSSSRVSWNITVSGSTTDPVVRLSDDYHGELREVGDNFFLGRWIYYSKNTDGGVIGELGGFEWIITIDPLLYSSLETLRIYDASGAFIALNLDTGEAGDIVLRAAIPNPEPGTLALLSTGILGLFGYGWRRKRQQI